MVAAGRHGLPQGAPEKSRYAVRGHRQDTESESESDDDMDWFREQFPVNLKPSNVRRWELFTPHCKLKYGDARPTLFLAKTPVFVEEVGEVVDSFFNTPIKTRMERCLIRIRALSLYHQLMRRSAFPCLYPCSDRTPSWGHFGVTQLCHGYARRDSLPLGLG